MIISLYGKLFLDYYNNKNNTKVTPKEFLETELFPLLYENNRTLMFALNSPFNNPATAKKTFEEKLELFFNAVSEGKFDASIMIGSVAKGFEQTNSFSISMDFRRVPTEDEIYYSWIASALSVYLGDNNIQFLFKNAEILYDIYLGWSRLKEIVTDEFYKGNKTIKISTYNGHWLETYIKSFKRPIDLDSFNPYEKKNLTNVSWCSLFYNMGNHYPINETTAYVFRYVKDNRTYGYVNIYLNSFKSMIDLYKTYFEDNDTLNTIEAYNTIYNNNTFEHMCMLGSFGKIQYTPNIPKLYYSMLKLNKKDKEKFIKLEIKFLKILYMVKYKLEEKDIEKVIDYLYDVESNRSTKSNGVNAVDAFLKVRTTVAYINALSELFSLIKNEEVFKILEPLTHKDNKEIYEIVSYLKLIYTVKK